MTLSYDLRLTEECARYFRSGEYSRIMNLLHVRLDSGDRRLDLLRDTEQEHLSSTGLGVVVAAFVERTYTQPELSEAELFQLIVTRRFEPVGEVSGTIYDRACVCKVCGFGRRQASILKLALRKLPRKNGFAVSLGGELVVSADVAATLLKDKFTGFHLHPIIDTSEEERTIEHLRVTETGREVLRQFSRVEALDGLGAAFYLWLSRPEMAELFARLVAEENATAMKKLGPRGPRLWFQLRVVGESVRLSAQTQAGLHPLAHDMMQTYVCKHGHTIGYNLMSEVYIERQSILPTDVFHTTQCVGWHHPGSVIYPQPIVGVSKRLGLTLMNSHFAGIKFEVIRIV